MGLEKSSSTTPSPQSPLAFSWRRSAQATGTSWTVFSCNLPTRRAKARRPTDRRKAHSLRVASTSLGPHPPCVPDRAAITNEECGWALAPALWSATIALSDSVEGLLGCCLADQYWDCRYFLARSRSFASSD